MSLFKSIAFFIIISLIALLYATALYSKLTQPSMHNLDGTGFAIIGVFVLILWWAAYSSVRRNIN
jgi:multisubunit Na+/H+ antiporter MnhG subunit